MFTCMLECYVAPTVLSVPKPFGGRWRHQWTPARRQRAPLQRCNQFQQSLEEGAKNQHPEYEYYPQQKNDSMFSGLAQGLTDVMHKVERGIKKTDKTMIGHWTGHGSANRILHWPPVKKNKKKTNKKNSMILCSAKRTWQMKWNPH